MILEKFIKFSRKIENWRRAQKKLPSPKQAW
jgi:hypothetical protein